MAGRFGRDPFPRGSLAEADFPALLRLEDGEWIPSTPETTGRFSRVGFCFARQRQSWALGEFPFYYVQLASIGSSPQDDPAGGDGRARIRNAQLEALTLKNTGMAVAIDVGAVHEHPLNKYDIGIRLARWAPHRDYGQRDLVPSGPIYKDHQIEGGRRQLALGRRQAGRRRSDRLLRGRERADRRPLRLHPVPAGLQPLQPGRPAGLAVQHLSFTSKNLPQFLSSDAPDLSLAWLIQVRRSLRVHG